jgi:hypothetical protein
LLAFFGFLATFFFFVAFFFFGAHFTRPASVSKNLGLVFPGLIVPSSRPFVMARRTALQLVPE